MMNLVIHCNTTIAIEDTSNLKIYPFCFFFDKLDLILKLNRMEKIFGNLWYKVHNFSPGFRLPGDVGGISGSNSKLYTLLENYEDASTINLLEDYSIFKPDFSEIVLPVPLGQLPETEKNAVPIASFNILSFLDFKTRCLENNKIVLRKILNQGNSNENSGGDGGQNLKEINQSQIISAPMLDPFSENYVSSDLPDVDSDVEQSQRNQMNINKPLTIFKCWEGTYKSLPMSSIPELNKNITTYWNQYIANLPKNERATRSIGEVYLICIGGAFGNVF